VPIKLQRPPVKKNRKNREKRIERAADFGVKPIILRWPYLWNPPLDHARFWICCSYYTYLLTDRRDWKDHNPFDRNHHQQCPGKQKGNAPAEQFGHRLSSLSSTVGSCSFLDM
jgi:hypothetical protein